MLKPHSFLLAAICNNCDLFLDNFPITVIFLDS